MKCALYSVFITLGLSSTTLHADYCYSNQNYSNANQTKPNTNTSDQEIARKVKEKLSGGWFSKGYDQVNVQVNQGNVTLQGTIPSWDDKETLEKEIRSIDGVKGLALRLNVQDSKKNDSAGISDQKIEKQVRDQLSSGWFAKGYEQVDVQVNNGIVTLQGFVNSQEDKNKLEQEVRKIDGVTNVNNQLNIQVPATDTSFNDDAQGAYSKKTYSNMSTSNASDQELATKIHDKLKPGWFSPGFDQVTAEVNNGIVNLHGSVKTWADKEKLEKEIRNMDGVRQLNSSLSVQDLASRGKPTDFQLDQAATAADDQLNRKIRDQVSRGWLWNDYKDVKLNTSGGVVTLEGNVNTKDDQQKLINEIQKVDGVASVRSSLKMNKQ